MRATKRQPSALIVSEDPGLREGVGRWLEEDGLEVMVCPGPRAPQFSCVGLRGEPCPLLGGVDVVVLDLHPEPGDLVERSSRIALVEHYRKHGKELLAMVDGAAETLDVAGIEGVALVERHADRGHLLRAVQELVGSHRPKS